MKGEMAAARGALRLRRGVFAVASVWVCWHAVFALLLVPPGRATATAATMACGSPSGWTLRLRGGSSSAMAHDGGASGVAGSVTPPASCSTTTNCTEDKREIKAGLQDLQTLSGKLLRQFGDRDVLDGDGGLGVVVGKGLVAAAPQRDLDAALVLAASEGDVDRVDVLLQQGARVNVLYVPPPSPAELQDGTRVRPSGCTPLHAAAEKGRAAAAARLLEGGARVNAADRDGGTALHRAAYWGQYEVAGELIGRGADVAARDHDGMTPLHNAAIQGCAEVAVRTVSVPVSVSVSVLFSYPGGGRPCRGASTSIRNMHA